MRSVVAFVGLVAMASFASAQEFTTLKGHGGPVMGLAVSPGGLVASASFDNSVGLWQGRAPIWLEGHDAAVVDVTFAGDDVILSGGDDFAVWRWRDGQGLRLGAHKGKVTDLAVDPNRSFDVSASWDGALWLWDLNGDAHVQLDQHDAGFSDVVFAPGGARLYAATSDGDILVYTLGSDVPPRLLVRHGFGINEMVIAPDETWLAYGAVDGVTRFVDPVSADEIRDFTLERRPILAMELDATSHQLAVGDGDGYIMVIDTENWKISRDFRAMREGPVWALAFSPGGDVIYAGGLDDVIYGWPVALLGEFEPVGDDNRSFLKDPKAMANGERQFMRKCSICHTLTGEGARKAGPTLAGVFGRRAGTVDGYRYSATLLNSDIVWSEHTIDQLFEEGPDNYIPASKMPMQRIAKPEDRKDLIEFLARETLE